MKVKQRNQNGMPRLVNDLGPFRNLEMPLGTASLDLAMPLELGRPVLVIAFEAVQA